MNNSVSLSSITGEPSAIKSEIKFNKYGSAPSARSDDLKEQNKSKTEFSLGQSVRILIKNEFYNVHNSFYTISLCFKVKHQTNTDYFFRKTD